MKTGFTIAFTFLLWMAGTQGFAQDCFPKCRKGFVCLDGKCVAESNASPALAGEKMDYTAIHALYEEGDFDAVTLAIEGYMKRNPSQSHADSVFIAKHLAVVYSAGPSTREKGKYYMYRLLDLEPAVRLVDMFVSDEVDRIFEKTREEFCARKGGCLDAKPRPDTVVVKTEARDTLVIRETKNSRLKPWIWAGAGAAVVGVGVGTVLLMQEGPSPKTFNMDASTGF